MHYYLFHPSIHGAYDDSPELLKWFMGIGKSYSHALEVGAAKVKQLETHESDSDLMALVNGFTVTPIEQAHAAVVEKVIALFGHDLRTAEPNAKASLSMITLLLNRGRYDVIEQIIGGTPIPAAEFSA